MSTSKNLKLVEDLVNKSQKKNEIQSVDKIASYLSRIGNHQELFKVGKEFQEEFKKGTKNFAFTSTGFKNSQQRMILGLCCYFDSVDQYRIAIVSDHLNYGVFDDLVKNSSEKTYQLAKWRDKVKYYSYQHHFDFFDFSELLRVYDEHQYTKTFDYEIKSILDYYDIVLWDVPTIEKMKLSAQFHYRISHFYEYLSVIVSPLTSSAKQVEQVKNFFANFNLNLRSILFETNSAVEKPKRAKILGF